MKPAILMLSTLACSAIACASPYEESRLSEPLSTESAAAPSEEVETQRWAPELEADRETRYQGHDFHPPVEPPELEPPPCRSVIDVTVNNDEDYFGPYFSFTYGDVCLGEELIAYVWQLPREEGTEGAYGPLEGVLYSADVAGEVAYRFTGEWIEDSNGDHRVIANVVDGDQFVAGQVDGWITFDGELPDTMFGMITYD